MCALANRIAAQGSARVIIDASSGVMQSDHVPSCWQLTFGAVLYVETTYNKEAHLTPLIPAKLSITNEPKFI